MRLLDELNDLVTRMRTAGEEHRQAQHHVRVDRDLTPEARDQRLRELSSAAHQRAATDHAEAGRLRERLVERTKQAERGVPAPSADAVARVRGLLQQGADPGEVLAMAVELGDGDAIEALRTEIKWANLGADVSGFIRRVDEASLPFLSPPHRSAREERLAIGEAWGRAKPYIDAESLPDRGPTLETAVAAQYPDAPLEPPPPRAGMEGAVGRALDNAGLATS